ncbi:hypothetical protein HLH10_03085 [Acinetobacter sp. ANC 4277]|uniref:glycosyltransferase family 52 n=1 Tax=Acinetobacter terrae TaxID=2731247 RepID=UPI0014904789|nr:glycosyltransferase family 52 [Acinetobacter terrae]NNG75319.1 hypothetical protein [Acinetobacter terrae]
MLNENEQSLIICLTPLQMLIAEKIIENNGEKKFDLLVISLFDNDKYEYYYNRLKNKVQKSHYFIYKPSNLINNLKNFLNFKKFYHEKFESKSYSNYYLASIDSRHCQYILSLAGDFNLYTFDDGTANIFPNSIYFIDRKSNYLKRFILKVLGVNQFTIDLKNRSLKHFTIYKNSENAFKNTFYLPLFSNDLNSNLNKKNKIKLLLGQPLIEYNKKLNYNYINNVISVLNIDLYLPHPREDVGQISSLKDVEVIQSNLIFEDLVIDILKNKSGNLELYSFTSSAAINCSSLSGVKLFFIYNDLIASSNVNIYKKIKDLGYSIVRI